MRLFLLQYELISCSLLLGLPQEIKDHIFRYVLGGRLIHVFVKSAQELDHTICCSHTRGADASQRVSSTTSEDKISFTPEKRPHLACTTYMARYLPRDDIRVLRTCRQIYIEACNILYVTNTFSFRDLTMIRRFMNHSRALAANTPLPIRKLDLHLSYGQRMELMELLVQDLGRKLSYVKQIHITFITMRFLYRDEDTTDTFQYLGSLRALKPSIHYDIVLSFYRIIP